MKDRLVCPSAAMDSQFELIKCLKEERRFKWDSNTIACAAEAGSFDIVELCLEEGCALDVSAAIFAACANGYLMLNFFGNYSCYLDESAVAGATICANLQVDMWFKDMGCPVGVDALQMASQN